MQRTPQIRYKDYNVVPNQTYNLSYTSEEFEGESLGNEHELDKVVLDINEDVKKHGITSIEQMVCSSIDKTMPIYKVTRFSNGKEQKEFEREVKTHYYNVSVKAKCLYTQEEADKLNGYYKKNDNIASELIERNGWVAKYKEAKINKDVKRFGGGQIFLLVFEILLIISMIAMLCIPSLKLTENLPLLFQNKLDKQNGLMPIIFLGLALLTIIVLIIFIISSINHSSLYRKNIKASKKINMMLTSNTETIAKLQKEYEELAYTPDDVHVYHIYSVHVKGNVVSYDLK